MRKRPSEPARAAAMRPGTGEPASPATRTHDARSPWISYPGQALGYIAFAAFVGYFSASPDYVHLEPGMALVKMSWQHAGARVAPCHERTPEELAKLAPNMRAATVCPRERAPVRAHVEIDGRPLFDVVAPPTGLGKDGAAAVYQRAVVPAGTYRLTATLVDTPAADKPYTLARTIDLAPGHVVVLDFDDHTSAWMVRQ